MNSNRIVIRPESLEDHDAIHQLHTACFPTGAEADLVDRLRTDQASVISLIAEDGGRTVGHILLSLMTAPFKALGLAPLSVDASHRKQGIAARLVEAALQQAKADGFDAVFVLGDPAYYQRFGFMTDKAAGFSSPYKGPYFMAISLQNDALPAVSGVVRYAAAFAAFED